MNHFALFWGLVISLCSNSPFCHSVIRYFSFVSNNNGIDYYNVDENNFFKAILKIEKGRKIAIPQSLLELKAYAFVQPSRISTSKKLTIEKQRFSHPWLFF